MTFFAFSRHANAQPAVPGQSVTRGGVEEKPVLGGFNVNLTLWESSGLSGPAEAYENQLTLYLEPELRVGKRWFRGRWAEPLTVSARMLVQSELSGNDPAFRGGRFAAPVVLRDLPEQTAIGLASENARAGQVLADGSVDGPERRIWYSDLWLSVTHDRVATIPKIGVDVSANIRVVLPVSLESRIAGLRAAPSLFLGLSKKLWRFHLDYGFRAIKYFYGSRVAPVGTQGGDVIINGQPVTPFQPASSGYANPDFGFVHAFTLSVDLPKDFSIVAGYYLFNIFAHALDRCTVPGLPTADVCADGQLLGDARSRAQRDSQWFLFEVDWRATSWFSLGLGLSTFGPVRLPNGDLANPFLRVSRENRSTVYLALSVSAEDLAAAIAKRKRRNPR